MMGSLRLGASVGTSGVCYRVQEDVWSGDESGRQEMKTMDDIINKSGSRCLSTSEKRKNDCPKTNNKNGFGNQHLEKEIRIFSVLSRIENSCCAILHIEAERG